MAGVNRGVKPEKPTEDFPLFPHAVGKWAIKIKGSTKYFGRWEDPDGALQEYRAWLDGGTKSVSGISIARACNLFLAAKDEQTIAGDLTVRSFRDYRSTCAHILEVFGREKLITDFTPSDFAKFKTERAKTRNLVSVGNEITRAKTLFKWLYDSRHLKAAPHFGPEFKKPSLKSLRKHRRETGKKLYTREGVHRLLDEAGVHLRAMIFLGINCAMGPHDIAMLPRGWVDLERAILDAPRSKTEADRICPLWPETVAALRLSLSRRAASDSQSFFVDYDGKPWSNDQAQLTKYFGAVRRRVLKDGGFYWLRHTFRTVADGAKDRTATNLIMGHVDASMGAVYREEIDLGRLVAVSNYVREWLYGERS